MDRGPRGFTLTEAGQVTLSEAVEILRQGHDLVQYFRSGKTKARFRVGALAGLSKNLQLKLLTPVLEQPSVEVALEFGDAKVLLDRLISYQLECVPSDLSFDSSEAEPLTQFEIQSETICLVPRKKMNQLDPGVPQKIKDGIYFPAKSSPITSIIVEDLHRSKIQFNARGFIEDIAFLRLLALDSNSLVVIPKIGVQREIKAKELFIVHESKKIHQKYFLIHREKGKRHPILSQLIKFKAISNPLLSHR